MNNDAITELINPIQKLSKMIGHDHPFLIYGVIGIFGVPMVVGFIYNIVKDLIITVICLVLVILFLAFCGILEARANINKISEKEKGFRRERK